MKLQETKWCEHGKTNHVYCADCEVNRLGQLCSQHIDENHKLSLENYALKLRAEEMQKTLEQIANTEWHPNADLVNVEIAYEMRALAKEALQSLKEDKP